MRLRKLYVAAMLAVAIGVTSTGCSSGVSQEEYDKVVAERDTLQKDIEELNEQKEELANNIETKTISYNKLDSQYDELEEKYEHVNEMYEELTDIYEELYEEFEDYKEQKKDNSKTTKKEYSTYSDDTISCKYDKSLLEPELQATNETISYGLFFKQLGLSVGDIFPSKTYLLVGSMYNTLGVTLEDFKSYPDNMIYSFSISFLSLNENKISDYKVNNMLDKDGSIECVFNLTDESVCKVKMLNINEDKLTYTAYKILSSDKSKYKESIDSCYESISIK